MTRKYFVTTDQIDNALSDSSENPVQNKVIKAAVDAKLNKAATAAQDGYVAMVKETGAGTGVYEFTPTAITPAEQADWTETDTSAQSFIKHKPFNSIGTGLTVTAGVLNANTQFKFQIFTTLPAAAEEYAQTIALIQKASTETGNVYDEYGCVSDGATPAVWSWEKLGAMKATVTQSATAIEVDGVALQTADDTKIGLMSKEDHADMQKKSNIVDSTAGWSATTSDTKYPSEKLVKTTLDQKQTTDNLVTTIAAAASALDTKYPSEKATATALEARVKFATGSTSTAFTVGKDANGYYIEE